MPAPSPSPRCVRWPVALLAACALVADQAQAQCAGSPPSGVRTLVERFVSADCQDCWTHPPSALAPGPSAWVVDWIVPGTQGEEAPLAAAALPEAHTRLESIGRPAPAGSDVHVLDLPERATPRLRVSQGPPVADYLGTVIQFPRPAAGAGPYQLTVVLVEALAAGDEGSPIARNVARGSFQSSWPVAPGPRGRQHARDWLEVRSMRIPEGARPERLRVLAWVQDSAGQFVAAAQSRCE